SGWLWCAGTRGSKRAVTHGGARRSSFPQRSGRPGDRDRRQGVHVRRRTAALRPSARVPRHGRRERDHLPVLLDPLSLRSRARSPRLAARRVRAAGRGRLSRRVARSRTVIIAGGGIGGLTAALALAAKGFRVVIVEQAARLEEAGAGIQLSPNATRILIALGLKERLAPLVVVPHAVRVRSYRGRDIVRVPLGPTAESRYGAPYWVIHRADLQAALVEAVAANPDIMLRLAARAEDFATHAHGITVQLRTGSGTDDEHG